MRKLTWAGGSFSLAIILCHYMIPEAMYKWAVVALLISAILGIIFLRHNQRIGILLVCVFSIFGIVRYDCHAKNYLDLADELPGDHYRITAYVAEYPSIYDDYTKITVHLRSDRLPEVKAVLYDYNQLLEKPNSLKPGDKIRTSVRFTSSRIVSGEETDTYISKGVYLRGYLTDNVTKYETWWGNIVYFPLNLAYEIQNILDSILPEHTSVFMKALLTGDKTELYEHPEIYHSLSRAGIAHIVAVSGMHVSFVVGIVMTFFGSRRGWQISLFAIFLFAIMTGLSPSVMRAAFMQTLCLIAPVLHRESDNITSLSFALLILLVANPFLIASISLQLSFAAMMGISLITPKIYDWFKIKGSVLNEPIKNLYIIIGASLSASLGAMLFTAPLCVLHFGNIAVLSPITNLLVLWIVPCCFSLGVVICVVSLFSMNTAMIFADILVLMVDFVYKISEMIAQISFSAVYLPKNSLYFWLLCVGVVIAVTYFIKGSGLYKPLLSVLFSVCLLIALYIGVKSYYSSDGYVAAIDVGQGQSIVIVEDDQTVLIDCGGAYDSGQATVEWLYSHGRESVELLIITHFDSDHVNGIEDLMTQIKVNEIRYCTLNLTDYEAGILKEIQENADRYGTKMTITNKTDKLKLGNICLDLFVPRKPQDNNGIIVLANIKNFDILVTGDADIDTEKELMQRMNLPDGECIIVGHHGSKYSTGETILDRFKPEIAIISCGINHFGHPTKEVLDRLEERNMIIYRTDILGNVEVKVR